MGRRGAGLHRLWRGQLAESGCADLPGLEESKQPRVAPGEVWVGDQEKIIHRKACWALAVVESPSLEGFKRLVVVVLGDRVGCRGWQCWANGWTRRS